MMSVFVAPPSKVCAALRARPNGPLRAQRNVFQNKKFTASHRDDLSGADK